MFDFLKKQAIGNRAKDEILYEYVLDEVESGFKVKGLWGKALAYSNGDDSKATSLYMQYRVQSLKDELDALKILYKEMSKSEIGKLLNHENRKKSESYSKNLVSEAKPVINQYREKQTKKTIRQDDKVENGNMYGIFILLGIIILSIISVYRQW